MRTHREKYSSIIVLPESAEANVLNEPVFTGAVEFPAGDNSESAGAAKAIETTSVEAKNSDFMNIRIASGQGTLL